FARVCSTWCQQPAIPRCTSWPIHLRQCTPTGGSRRRRPVEPSAPPPHHALQPSSGGPRDPMALADNPPSEPLRILNTPLGFHSPRVIAPMLSSHDGSRRRCIPSGGSKRVVARSSVGSGGCYLLEDAVPASI